MRLFALMLCPFAFTTGAFVFSGVLHPMADALGTTVAKVALLQSAFAISCAISGPILTQLTRRLPPRAILLAVLALLALTNAVSAIARDYTVLFALRALTGGIGALALPLATVLAAQGAAPQDRAKSVSIVYAGIPLALIAGIPLGSFLGNQLGWPACFALTSGICILALCAVLALVPDGQRLEQDATPFTPDRSFFLHLGITCTASAALFCLAGLIGPIIRASTHFSGSGIAAVQVLVGVGGLLGVRMGARLAKRGLRSAFFVPFTMLSLSLGVMIHPSSTASATPYTLIALLLSVVLGPAAQSVTGVLVQSHFAARFGPSASLAYALNGSMVYLGQGLGVAVGAACLNQFGLESVPFGGFAFVLLGLALTTLLLNTLNRSSHV